VTEPTPVTPWYKRDLLPSWVPGWLAGSVLIGLGFAVAFGLGLGDDDPWPTAVKAGLLGFGFGLIIFSWASVTGRPTPDGPRFAPPNVIRWPIVTALLCLGPFFWMTEGKITTSPSNGGRTLMEGVAVEGIAIAALVLLSGAIGWRVRKTWLRSRRVAAGEALSLAVALTVLGYGLVVIVVRHFG
jgi:hypothetical protein